MSNPDLTFRKWAPFDPNKLCRVCNNPGQFRINIIHGISTLTNVCRTCFNKRQWKKLKGTTRLKEKYERANLRTREKRFTLEGVTSFIFLSSRKADKKTGRENDLTKQFIRELITRECSYCGETKIRMTLDRIDNKVGHIQSNVNSSCIRCNYLRRDMPYAAWLSLCESIRKTRESGLFGEWLSSGVFRPNQNST